MKIRKRWSRFHRSLAGKERTSNITIRLSKTELDFLRLAARRVGKTLNDFIVDVLRQEIDRRTQARADKAPTA